MNEILQALETLVANNCLTVSEALDKAYLAGHRCAVKQLEPTQLALVGVDNVASARGKSPKQ